MPIPSASAIITVVLVPLLSWRIYVRFRRASGRQRLSRYRAPITLTLYALIIGAVSLANVHRPVHLIAFALALLAGGCLATFALRRTRFDTTPKGLFYTPHGPIGISLAVLFVARIVYRVVEVYLLDATAPRSAAEFAQSPLTLGAFGLLAGYYVWYTFGLARWRYRVLNAKKAREAARSDA
ncbi:MAG: hypothetical protein ACXWJM_12730 [Ramlibacter sp.]